MTEQRFAVFYFGDVVMLKSGGPRMTVAKIENESKALCYWYGDNKAPYSAHFETWTIRHVGSINNKEEK